MTDFQMRRNCAARKGQSGASPVPYTVTTAPPATPPTSGCTRRTALGARYVNASAPAPASAPPPALTASSWSTRTRTVPAAAVAAGGVEQRTSSSLSRVAPTASAAPNWQSSPRAAGMRKPRPRSSTSVPPCAGPARGRTACMRLCTYS